MKAASVNEIQKELKELSPKELFAICIRLTKYKLENKELISYLLFHSADEDAYVETLKEEITEAFKDVNRSNLYQAKKTIRKILRFVNKFSKYSGKPETELHLRIHFLSSLKNSGVPYNRLQVLQNLYIGQYKKILSCFDKLHEDLQFDFKKDVEKLSV